MNLYLDSFQIRMSQTIPNPVWIFIATILAILSLAICVKLYHWCINRNIRRPVLLQILEESSESDCEEP